jgi:hypothetical protein
MLACCSSKQKGGAGGSARKRRRATSAASESVQRPGLRAALEPNRAEQLVPAAATPSSAAASSDDVRLRLDAASPLPVELLATMSIAEELPSCPPPPSPALLPPVPRFTLTKQMSTDDELSAMLASVTTSKTSSTEEAGDHDTSLSSTFSSMDPNSSLNSTVSSIDHDELAGILPGGDDALLAAVPQQDRVEWLASSERSPPMAAPDSPFMGEFGPLAKTIMASPAGGAPRGVEWEVFCDDLETNGAVRNGSKILELEEKNQLLVWNSKLRDTKPVGFSTLRIEGVGPGRMPVQLEMCAKGQQQPIAVEQVRTVADFSGTSYTGLKVERMASDNGATSCCNLRIALRIGPYEGTKGGGGAKGTPQKLGCDRACCVLPTAEIGFTPAQGIKSTLGEDDWLIPHAYSATSDRLCEHTFTSSVRSALQGKAAKSVVRQYPFYFVAVLEDSTRILVQGGFRLQSGSDQRMAAMTEQKRNWRQDNEKVKVKAKAGVLNSAATRRRKGLATRDSNEQQQQPQAAAAAAAPTAAAAPAAGGTTSPATPAGASGYTSRCKHCGEPKKSNASKCPCPKPAAAAAAAPSPLQPRHQFLIEESPAKMPALRLGPSGSPIGGQRRPRPDYTTKCRYCGVPKKQAASKCPCKGTGLHPGLTVAMGAVVGLPVPAGAVGAAAAAAAAAATGVGGAGTHTDAATLSIGDPLPQPLPQQEEEEEEEEEMAEEPGGGGGVGGDMEVSSIEEEGRTSSSGWDSLIPPDVDNAYGEEEDEVRPREVAVDMN